MSLPCAVLGTVCDCCVSAVSVYVTAVSRPLAQAAVGLSTSNRGMLSSPSSRCSLRLCMTAAAVCGRYAPPLDCC